LDEVISTTSSDEFGAGRAQSESYLASKLKKYVVIKEDVSLKVTKSGLVYVKNLYPIVCFHKGNFMAKMLEGKLLDEELN
jgi:hypothetical protein